MTYKAEWTSDLSLNLGIRYLKHKLDFCIAMIKDLTSCTHEEIVDCLHDAFSDYALPMKMPYGYWKNRWQMAKLNTDLSYGYFDKDSLKGFILHGIDTWKDETCFYNMATGVVPAYRRKGILSALYKKALPHASKASCTCGYLEVLCNNTKAVKAYEKSGFSIIDKADSFIVSTELQFDLSFRLHAPENWNTKDYEHLIGHDLSFEHRSSVIKRDPDSFECFVLREKDNLAAFAIVKKSNHNMVQFGFLDGNIERYGPSLFGQLVSSHPGLKIINISEKDEALISFFKKYKFRDLISQYIMRVQL